MRRNLGIIVLSCITIGLVVLFLLLMGTNDTTGPVISYDKNQEMVYDTAQDPSVLLEGVTASDAKDGDVSNSLMIQDINYSADGRGTVTYVAKDKSNNITTVKRKFLCQTTTPIEQPDIESIYAAIKQQQLGKGLPYLRLLTKEVTLAVGSPFVIQDYVQEIENAGEEPMQRLELGGNPLDTTQPGTYVVQVSVTDLNGNRSNIEEVTITIQ